MDILIAVLVGLAALGGIVSGYVAMVLLRFLKQDVDSIETRVSSLDRRLRQLQSDCQAGGHVTVVNPPPLPENVTESRVTPAPAIPQEEHPPVAAEAPVAPPSLPPSGGERPSLEVVLGTKWMAWVGMVFVLVGVALGLKYIYDNNIIGPRGRLAIGVMLGTMALVAGENVRRRRWHVLFQTLTGGGIAIFYICTYFAFQVYHLSGQSLSMGLATLVTIAAVVLAVTHNALPIAVLAVLGGFLSPVLLSSGENHPYLLFTYVLLLDLVALGATYFRRWRALDTLCLAGTAVLYALWMEKFYGKPDQPDQFVAAMLFVSLFYLVFLLIPTLQGILRKQAGTVEGVTMVVANSVLSFAAYYRILFESNRHMLAFVVIGQALLVFLLSRIWAARVSSTATTARSLLIVALALVTLAIPIQLRFYGIPLAWAVEGALFVYLGRRYASVITRVGGVGAVILASGGLVQQLPLHDEAFRLITNAPFGSWLAVAMAATLATRFQPKDSVLDTVLRALTGVLATALFCTLLTLETSAFWRFSGWEQAHTFRAQSLIVLWAVFAVASIPATRRFADTPWYWLHLPICAIGTVFFFVGLDAYDHNSTWLFLNRGFPFFAVLPVAFWWIGRVTGTREPIWPARVVEGAGHALLTMLFAYEFVEWSNASSLLSDKMGISLISAAWAVQAFVLVWLGLATQSRVRRYLGFVLFGLTIAKVLVLDTNTLDKVYRVVSFLACGGLLLVAATVYTRYKARLFGEEEETP
ncbi:MAG TPA: DUF2339 domain-containing protein [Candidatus Hydrogenedentes bacterium]|nr:DUF2339 domain-containing protein [Candidatus Hydrogenedentota bacterium]HPG69188.1 DUF2339 domain-containing protein [Candidatus Hydrogenedentota bacterium]